MSNSYRSIVSASLYRWLKGKMPTAKSKQYEIHCSQVTGLCNSDFIEKDDFSLFLQATLV